MKNVMNKLRIIAVIAALGIAGYVIINKYVTHIQNVNSENVLIQKIALGLACKHDHSCNSGYCKLGTCRSKTAGCYNDSDCQSGYTCSQPNDKMSPGYCEANK